MADRKDVCLLSPDHLESVGGGMSSLGVYRTCFQHKHEQTQNTEEPNRKDKEWPR